MQRDPTPHDVAVARAELASMVFGDGGAGEISMEGMVWQSLQTKPLKL